MTPLQFFIAESIKLARSMPISEARVYLAGLLDALGETPESHDVRHAFTLLDASDRQLELLTTVPPTRKS
jgi:HD-like signal output (HDOD) protein